MNILWDFDGTLMDTYPSYTKMVKEASQSALQDEEIFALLKVSFGHAFSELGLSEDEIKHIKELERSLAPEDFKPFLGLREVLEAADMNVIMTHKERALAQAILEVNDLNQYFTEIVAIDDGYPRKPDPASYRYLHEKYRIDLAVGDRELDIIPAKKLGIQTCLFQNHEAEADYYVDDYREFFKKVLLLNKYQKQGNPEK
ncbi:phosphoglycolate phosphatase [Pradoshia eiseniae]|uniref:Phosphoglycolate phosphatase n=1 Tax=Pradoshia eiseniae TaxID=2064768 RepID=A0A2S7N4Q9_9BACI|nr:HAD-IA family hydrolase [Pradoshia eiseniae]PQD97061.1 phosphoglycolate phosphatase [Pradoshia eiseniae]